MGVFNILLIVWVAYTMVKDKFEWWFIRKKIDSLLCFYCLSFWTYLIYSHNLIDAAYASFIAYWYIKLQEFLKKKMNK